MASTANNGLPVIPLSPIAQSFIICKHAIHQASEKLTEAKKVRPHLGVDVLRGFLETVKLERHRLDTLTRKMQSVEAATALFWDSDALARQIAVIDCQLYSHVLLDKRSLSQLDADGTKLVHLVDFHHYLTHSFTHQLIYWAELIKPENAQAAVIPPVHGSKDSLVTHLIRVAYLLLHAYRDYSGFAAIMKALSCPEVKRLKKIWQPCSSRTKDMFRDLVLLISPQKNYLAYYDCLKTSVQQQRPSHSGGGMMTAVPWIQPHLLSIRSIVTAYTAGDDHDQNTGDIVLSAPGAHKLNIELSILELCQHNSTIDAGAAHDFEEQKPTHKRASMAANKAIHMDGLRTAVIPVNNLNHLAPGDQLTHHWLVSRVYLRKDQLINESMEVEPLKQGESITCDIDEFEEAMHQHKSRPVSMASSKASSIPPNEPSSPQPEHPPVQQEEEDQELVDIVRPTHIVSDSDSNSSDEEVEEVVVEVEQVEQPIVEPVLKEHEVTPEPVTTTDIIEEPTKIEPAATPVLAVVDEGVDPLLGQDMGKEEAPVVPEQPAKSESGGGSSVTSSEKQKSRLSPAAPEFVPGKANSSTMQPSASILTTSTSAEEKWLGYPIKEEEESIKETESEKWNGYPPPATTKNHVSNVEEEEEDEVWKGYPGPNSNTDSPRRASSQSETSEEWKGYQAMKEEADWQRESALKVQQHEWQGYALETLDEDELDSSTMMDGEFEKSRQARGRQGQEETPRKKHA